MSVSVRFSLPAANEATLPPERRGLARDGVRLLVSDRTARAHHDAAFRDLVSFLHRGDLLVVNDSATLPAALAAHHAGGTPFALHLSTRIAGDLWIAEPRKLTTGGTREASTGETCERVFAGEAVALAEDGVATFLAPVDSAHPRLWYVALEPSQPVEIFLARHGAPIRYRYVTEALPLSEYQTVFARVPGSAEMPSAGRPFTQRVLDDLAQSGVSVASITLHTGVSSPARHERPYREWYDVPPATAAAVNATHRRGGRVVAVGTTVVRALESAVASGQATAASGWTELIVTPERGVAVVDGLLTGFHEPEASHLDLLRAFADEALLAGAYGRAIARGYLWHEFGDVHLLL